MNKRTILMVLFLSLLFIVIRFSSTKPVVKPPVIRTGQIYPAPTRIELDRLMERIRRSEVGK